MIHYTGSVFWVTTRIPGLPYSAEAPKVGEKMDIEGAFQDRFTRDMMGFHRPIGSNVVHLCSFKPHIEPI